VYGLLASAYNEVLDDLGEDEVSHTKAALIERFVFLEFMVRGLEKDMTDNPDKARKLLNRWIRSSTALSRFAKSIGLERCSKQVHDLNSYIDKRKKRA